MRAFLILLLSVFILSCGGHKTKPKPIKGKPTNLKEVICLAAKEKNVDCAIMYAIAGAETNHENIYSEVDIDSAGIFQIRPSTASWLLKRKVTREEIKSNIYLASQIAVLRYLDCKRAMSKSARQIRIREVICFNRGPSGTWEAVRWWHDLSKLKYWKRYESHWVKFKREEGE